MTNRINWTRSSWSIIGHVNNTSPFVVAWGNSSDKSKPYTLYAELPGVKDTRHASEEDAQQHAETVLSLFVDSIGATFY